jgi:anti-sigma-K factor RskA
MSAQDQTIETHELAGEYVLGTLQGDARDRFERRLVDDVDLQREVAAWERRLAPMLEGVAPVSPPPQIWRAIEARINPVGQRQVSGIWHSLGFWRALSLVSVSLVLALSLSLFMLLPGSGELEQIMVVTNDQSQAGWIVDTRRRDPMLNVSAVQPSPLPPGKVCQLWLETAQGTMIPVGVLPHEGSRRMRIPETIQRDSRFKVTIEADAEVPVEQPSEQVVFEGRLISI